MVNINVKKFSRSKNIDQQEELPINEPIQEDSNFLNDLNKSNYEEEVERQKQEETQKKLEKEPEKENIKIQKQQEKENIKLMKEIEKKNKKIAKETISNDDELFSEEGTQLLGKEKHILLKKVKQYKQLFPDQLNKFKIKPNANEEQLKNYLEEMDIIVQINSVDDFLLDSIIQSLKVIEQATAHTQNYNIVGLADLLKTNPQFISLCKQLFIKYGSYSKIAPEYQMLFLVATSAYVIRNKNKEKKNIEAFLNEPITQNPPI
jgi:hypothetical protein